MFRPAPALALLFSALAAFAEPAPMVIPGESRPDLEAVDSDVLQRYSHDRITHITFHHEGFAGHDAALFARASAARDRLSLGQRMRNLNHFHAADRNFGMIAYHYAIDKSGGIAKGRPVRFKPATGSTVIGGAARADFDGHFAVVALGDFNHETLTEDARLALVAVMSQAQRQYAVPEARIQPHKHHASTSCPGETMLAEAASLARRTTLFSLQSELARRGCGGAAPDGIAGAATVAAFRRFTAANPDYAQSGLNDDTLQRMLSDTGAGCSG